MQLVGKINQGIDLLVQNGHNETAQWMLEKLVADYPDHAIAHYQLAILAHKSADNHTAAVHFKKAAELRPQDPIMQKSLGDFYHVSQKDLDKAIVQYEAVLKLTPNDPQTLLITAHLYLSLRQFDKAGRLYERLLTINPAHDEARQILEKLKAQQAEQQSPEQLYQNALSEAAAGNTTGAISCLETLLGMTPDHALAHNDLGVLYFELGDKQKAFAHYQRATELEPQNVTYLKNLADFFFIELNDAQNALKLNVRILKLNPEDVECLMSTGYICVAQALDEDARSFFNCVLDIEPWNKEAVQALDQLKSRTAPVSPNTANDTELDLYSEAQHSASAGDKAGAIRFLEQVIAREPNHAMAHNDLGVLYYEQGDKNNALRYYEMAHRYDPNNHTIMKNLADFHFVEQGRIQEAMTLYVQILEANKEDVDALMASGMVCLALGNNDDARTFFERVLQIEPWHQSAKVELDRIDSAMAVNTQPQIASGSTVIV